MNLNNLHVYVICINKKIKIGVSSDPLRRMEILLTKNEIINSRIYYTDKIILSRKIEKITHATLHKYSIGNEWFNYDFNKAVWVVKNLVNIHKLPTSNSDIFAFALSHIDLSVLENSLIKDGFYKQFIHRSFKRGNIPISLAESLEKFTTISSMFWIWPECYDKKGYLTI